MKLSKAVLEALFRKAGQTMLNSYSPYSKFKVGAAVLTKNGHIYGGTNIENASYGVTLCAERNAIFAAVCNGEKEFEALVIVFKQKNLGPLSTPCGACRQVMSEFCKLDMPIYTADLSTGKPQRIVRKKLKDYIPFPFSPDALLKKPAKKK